jgi:hypothetical protein
MRKPPSLSLPPSFSRERGREGGVVQCELVDHCGCVLWMALIIAGKLDVVFGE